MSPLATIETTLSDAAHTLSAVSESPQLDAEALLAWVLGTPRSYLFTHPEEELRDRPALDFSDAIDRRGKGEPVAYIIGSKEFWSMELSVCRDTLVPRPETEILVERALQLIPEDRPYRVLDLGTGSGAIAIALASENPNIEVVATDSNGNALAVARENADLHKLPNIRFLLGDWTEPVVDQTFDLIVSNPPYVRDDDPALDELRYEPRSALAAGPDGLNAIRRIAKDTITVVAPNGSLLLEHGAEQREAVATVLQENGWTDIECIKDLAGHPRVTTARMSAPPLRDQA